jgi:hypothetical protein
MSGVYISSLSQYIESIARLKSYYPSVPFLNNPTANQFVYRGLCNKAYTLLPGVFRQQTDIVAGRGITNDTYLAWTKEKDLLYSFIHEASGTLTIPTDDHLHWAEYAQHYGVPTRFMDWSKNPLVALYFACRDRTTTDGAVWLLHRTNYTRFLGHQIKEGGNKKIHEIIGDIIDGKSDVEYPILYTPYYVDARMSAQGSYFMVWGKLRNPLETMLSADNLQMILPDTDDGSRVYGKEQEEGLLFRFDIYADRKQPLLHELDIVGINEKTLFPGLDGIGRYVERKYRFDYNETMCKF